MKYWIDCERFRHKKIYKNFYKQVKIDLLIDDIYK